MNSTTSPGLAAQAPTPTAPANEAAATTGLPGIPALPVDSGPDTLPAPRPGFDFAKAELYLSRLSSMDLRQVLRVLRIKGKMGAPVKEKRSSALEMMRARDMGDEEVEAWVDDLDIESASAHSGLAPRTLSSLLTVVPATSSPAPPPTADGAVPAVSNGQSGRDGLAVGTRWAADTASSSMAIGGASGAQGGSANPLGRPPRIPRGSTTGIRGANPGPSRRASQSPSVPAAAEPGRAAGAREPEFTANDVARLFHVVCDPMHKDALRKANQPMSRADLDREHVSLWTSVLGPLYNRESYRPEPPALIDGMMDVDLRGMDPSKHSGQRDPSKLEGHYRTLRSLYTVAVANYTRSGQNEPVFKSFVRGDHRLLYIHCLLKGSDAADFVLRTVPTGAQCEVGLPNRTRVEDTEPTPAKRAKVAHVAVQGLSGLTSALAGFAKAMAPASSADTTAAEIYDNAESIGAVTKQLRAARQDLLADPTDEIAARVVKHLELQVSKLLG